MKTGSAAVTLGCLASSTGELTLDHSDGLLYVATPLCCAVAGHLGGACSLAAGALSVTTTSDTGACIWQSLDQRPAAQSARWTLKLATAARNTGQQVRIHLQKKDATIFALDAPGAGPVTTCGQASETPTGIALNGAPLLRAFLRNGTLELHRDGQRLWLYCDTPGVELELPRLQPDTVGAAHQRAGAARQLRVGGRFVWPDGVVAVEVVLPPGG